MYSTDRVIGIPVRFSMTTGWPSTLAAWSASTTLHAVYPVRAGWSPPPVPLEPSAHDAFVKAVRHGDEHVIKFADTALCLLVDRSGSMGGAPLATAALAAAERYGKAKASDLEAAQKLLVADQHPDGSYGSALDSWVARTALMTDTDVDDFGVVLVRMAGGGTDTAGGTANPDAAMADYARRLRDDAGSGLSAEAREALDHVSGGLGGTGGGGGELWGSSGGGAG